MKPRIIFKCGAAERYDNGLIQHIAWPVQVNFADPSYLEALKQRYITIAVTPPRSE